MATHTHASTSTPARSRSRRRSPARALTVLCLATAGALACTPAGTGVAEPAPTLAQVQARADSLDLQVDQAVEQYAQAQLALQDLQVRSQAAQAELTRQQATFAVLQAQAGQVVAAAYRGAQTGRGTGLMLLTRSSSPQAYLERATALDRIADDQSRRMAEVDAARERLDVATRAAAADLAAQQAVEQRAAERKTTIEADLKASQALLGSLQEEQRAQLAAARAAQQAQDAARSAEVLRASRSRDVAAAPAPAAPAAPVAPGAGGAVPAPAAPAAPAGASGRAAVAVQAAYSRLGMPYVWAASGPTSFDCSGLTSWVWAQAGVSLPHSAAAQYGMGTHVSQSQVQPGDLVFYGSPIHHVGIYIGGGNMISAPHTGDVVKIQLAFRSDYVGATRL